jgi:hypothetical protein
MWAFLLLYALVFYYTYEEPSDDVAEDKAVKEASSYFIYMV